MRLDGKEPDPIKTRKPKADEHCTSCKRTSGEIYNRARQVWPGPEMLRAYPSTKEKLCYPCANGGRE